MCLKILDSLHSTPSSFKFDTIHMKNSLQPQVCAIIEPFFEYLVYKLKLYLFNRPNSTVESYHFPTALCGKLIMLCNK